MVALLLIGVAEGAWAIAVLRSDRLPVPGWAALGALVPVAGWALLVTAAVVMSAPGITSDLPAIPMLAATLLDLVVAAVVGRHLRSRAESEAQAACTAVEATFPADVLVGSGASLPSAAVSPAVAATALPAATAAGDASSAGPEPERTGGRYLVGVLVGAFVVAGLVTPALSLTRAGKFAVPHGQHSSIDLDGIQGEHSGH
ncbi:hypothetical protein MAFF212519_11130 [Clavibacter michiganensis]